MTILTNESLKNLTEDIMVRSDLLVYLEQKRLLSPFKRGVTEYMEERELESLIVRDFSPLADRQAWIRHARDLAYWRNARELVDISDGIKVQKDLLAYLGTIHRRSEFIDKLIERAGFNMSIAPSFGMTVKTIPYWLLLEESSWRGLADSYKRWCKTRDITMDIEYRGETSDTTKSPLYALGVI